LHEQFDAFIPGVDLGLEDLDTFSACLVMTRRHFWQYPSPKQKHQREKGNKNQKRQKTGTKEALPCATKQ
jgi:hypothetical protein